MTQSIIENASTLAFGASLAPGDVHLRLLNVTDLHMEIHAYDYFADRETEGGGLARAASFIEVLRGQAPNTLLFDNGDFLQGNPMGDFAVSQTGQVSGGLHPMIAALNTLGPDAATIGNHEFNYGLPFLQAALAGATFPLVSANAVTRLGPSPDADETMLSPFVLLQRTFTDEAGQPHDLTVGVIGLLPPQTVHWDRRHLAGKLHVRDIVETARALVPRIRAEGADLVVALSHSGIDRSEDIPGLEDASIPLAAVEGIDAIITGHSHLVFPSPGFDGLADVDAERGYLHGKPATMAGFGGSHVGVIDLCLSRSGSTWAVRDSRVATPAVPASELSESATERRILAVTETAHHGTLRYIRQPIGETNAPLESYFAMLEPSPSVRFVATAQHWYTRQALQDTEHGALPLLSAAACFKTGGRGGPGNFTDVPAGPVVMRNVADLYCYPNMLCALKVTGTDLSNWLEYSAGFFHRIEAGSPDQPLVDEAFPSYNFDMIVGVTYEIDLAQPARFSPAGALIAPEARRIVNLRHDGKPVTPEMQFIVATNDYRASRSGTFPGADESELVLSAHRAHRDILIGYLRETGPDRPLAAPPWSLRLPPGASVAIKTGPGARAYPDKIGTLGLEPMERADDGSLQYRKRF